MNPRLLSGLKALLPERLLEWRRTRAHRREYEAWQRAGSRPPLPHYLKQRIVDDYRGRFGLRTLVETGTYLGYMVDAQKRHFDRVISIELSPELYARAVDRFKRWSHIEIRQGDSGEVLKQVVPTLTSPALFWLDAHYSAGITARSDKDTPILAELAAVFASQHRHVVLIDDAREFTGQSDYPGMEELRTFLRRHAPNHALEARDDVIRICPV